jgi:hypothetical protein
MASVTIEITVGDFPAMTAEEFKDAYSSAKAELIDAAFAAKADLNAYAASIGMQEFPYSIIGELSVDSSTVRFACGCRRSQDWTPFNTSLRRLIAVRAALPLWTDEAKKCLMKKCIG